MLGVCNSAKGDQDTYDTTDIGAIIDSGDNIAHPCFMDLTWIGPHMMNSIALVNVL